MVGVLAEAKDAPEVADVGPTVVTELEEEHCKSVPVHPPVRRP